MKAPTCRICQASHWSGEPHQFPKSAKSEPKAEKVVKAREQVAAVLAKPSGCDRKGYQREYMRKWAAAKRAKGKAVDQTPTLPCPTPTLTLQRSAQCGTVAQRGFRAGTEAGMGPFYEGRQGANW